MNKCAEKHNIPINVQEVPLLVLYLRLEGVMVGIRQ